MTLEYYFSTFLFICSLNTLAPHPRKKRNDALVHFLGPRSFSANKEKISTRKKGWALMLVQQPLQSYISHH